MGLLFANS